MHTGNTTILIKIEELFTYLMLNCSRTLIQLWFMLDTINKVMTSDVGHAKLPSDEGYITYLILVMLLKSRETLKWSVFLESTKCRSGWPFKTAFMTSNQEIKLRAPSSCWYLLVHLKDRQNFCLGSPTWPAFKIIPSCFNINTVLFQNRVGYLFIFIVLFYSSCFTSTTRCLCSSVCLPLVQFKEKTTQLRYLYRKCVFIFQ